jgi:hypothetical protein
MVRSKREVAAHTRPRWYRRRASIAAMSLLVSNGLSACGSRIDDGLHSTDTGNPPVVDSRRITARLDGEAIVVSGRPGAVPAGAEVLVLDETRETTAGTTAASDGSFELDVQGQGGDVLTVSVEVNGETSSATLEAPEAPSSPVDAGAPPLAVTDAGPVGIEARDVDWPNVDWSRSISIEPSSSFYVSPGLWMGTGVDGGGFTVEPAAEPPYELSSEPVAQRIAGTAPSKGGDTYFHLASPVERAFEGVYFWARSRAANGQTLRVTLGGASELYWAEVNGGGEWPAWQLTLGDAWSKHELTFTDLGFDADNLAPYSDPWGALHFLTSADETYDFEVYDLLFVNFQPD